MKILQVCPFFPESPLLTSSGVVHAIYEISKQLVKHGNEVTICTSSAENYVGDKQILGTDKRTILDGIEILRFPYLIGHRSFNVTWQAVPYVKKNLKAFDVVHIHDARCFQSIVASHYAKKYGFPYVIQPHGSYLGTVSGNKLQWFLDHAFSRAIIKNSNEVLVLNKTEERYYLRSGIPAKKIEIVENGVDLSRFRQGLEIGKFRKRFGVGTHAHFILYVGRLTETKGLDLLINAFATLKLELQNVKLVLIGADYFGYEAVLKNQVSNLGLKDCILFTGPLDESDTRSAYIDADVFVTPSFTGFPLTFLESCACGTPIVTTTNADTLDWIDGKVGYVTAYKKDELAEAILNILCEDTTRADFKANCGKLVEKQFGWSNVVDKIEETYRRAMGT